MAPVILLAIFLGIPVIEIALFVVVGNHIGLGWTLVAVVLMAIAGSALLRRQGVSTARRAQEALARGEPPLREVFDGACLLLAGVLLLTPGFFTDILALLLFLPPVRSGLLLLLARQVRRGTIHVQATVGGTDDGGSFADHGPTVEGEWRDVTPDPSPGAARSLPSRTEP